MKNFTKVLLICAVSLGLTNESFAQYDVATDSVLTPAAGATVNTVLTYPFNIRFRNNGPGSIAANTQVEVNVKVNGTPIGPAITGFTVPAAGMPMGGTLVFPPSQSLVVRFNVPPSSGTVNVCYEVSVVGNADPNAANNEICVTYNVEPGTTVDLAMSDLKITVPNIPNGGTIGGAGQTITAMEVTITNNGDFTYPAGYAITYNLEVEGETPIGTSGIQPVDLVPNGTNTRMIGNISIIPPLPSSGPFRMCATATVSNDVDNTNNKTCTDFVSAVGIEDVKNGTALSTVYFNNNSDILNVFLSQSIKGLVNMTITSTGGQTIKNVEFKASGQQKEEVDLNGIANGLYVLTISTSTGEVETQKFVVN